MVEDPSENSIVQTQKDSSCMSPKTALICFFIVFSVWYAAVLYLIKKY